jgi:hypothetical protein
MAFKNIDLLHSNYLPEMKKAVPFGLLFQNIG